MDFLNPGHLGNLASFRRKYALPIERYQEASRTDSLRRLVAPFLLRRLKTDKNVIADLPEKMEQEVLVNLTREQATLYEAVVRDMLQAIDAAKGIERRGLVLAALTKLKQVCDHPALFLKEPHAQRGRSGKLSRLTEMLEEALAEGDRCLVFTQYAVMGGMLQAHLRAALDVDALLLTGATTKKARDAMVVRFQQEADAPPVLVLSVKAGGVGLNLTRASRVFHYDRWWNPAVEDQATDRAFRIGQTKNVHVHKFVCAGTVEERIADMLRAKKGLAERIVGAGESWVTELSTKELRRLFTLSANAIVEE
jgi:SNF2 family DNA or RNA helicase